jgi:predicted phage tail protein
MMSFEADAKSLKEETDRMWLDYKEEETKYHSLNIVTKIFDALKNTISMETQFLETPDARFSDSFKSVSEMYSAKLELEDEIIKELKAHQRYIEDNLENNGL